MDSTSPNSLYLLVGLLLSGYLIFRRLNRVSIADVPGPEPESWLLGNYRQLLQEQVGEADSQWHAQFGDIVRIKAPFGADALVISDPKAIQFIYHGGDASFDKEHVRQERLGLVTGRGLVWAQGDIHRRQRKIINPAFGTAEAKSYIPSFLKGARRLTEKWKGLIEESDVSPLQLSTPEYVTRATMDVIGETAFGHEFNSLFSKNPIIEKYETIMTVALRPPPTSQIILQSFLSYFPLPVMRWFFDNAPLKAFIGARTLNNLTKGLSQTLVETKKQEALADNEAKRKKDILSVIVRANLEPNRDTHLTDEELWATMTTMLGAGHESTSNTITWSLQELSKHPDIQSRMRQEVTETWNKVTARGDTELNSNDLDKMEYTVAVIKEILRYYPVSYYNPRETNQDTVIPLSKPLRLKSGRTVTEIAVPKGTAIFTPPHLYNKNKEIFGEDAYLFNPDRWLNNNKLDAKLDTKSGTVGVYGNLMSFGSGVRACIGWRFAVYNIQSFLTELIRNFHFEPTPEMKKVRKESCILMIPIMEGELEKGPQMPLKISLVKQEEDY